MTAKKLTYPQWFALLALKHFSPERPGGVIRRNTLRSLVDRELATEGPDGFSITTLGIFVEGSMERAPR